MIHKIVIYAILTILRCPLKAAIYVRIALCILQRKFNNLTRYKI